MKYSIYLAECLGTFALVLAGCGAIVVDQAYAGTLGHLGVSLVFGLIVMAMIYSVGNISGAHINPAVTIAFVYARRLKKELMIPYIASQLIGATVAALLLRLLFPENGTFGMTVPTITLTATFLVEVVISFLLMFVILNVSTGHKEEGVMAGVAIGGFVAIAALVAGPLTGASMNPARSFGPALVAVKLDFIWIYLLAPVIGTLLACPFCKWIQGDSCCQPSTKEGPVDGC